MAIYAGLRKLKEVRLEPDTVDSNIVIFRLNEGAPSVPVVLARLRKAGVLMGGMRGGIRAVTHIQVSTEDCQRALDAIRDAVTSASGI